ncbi:cyd operon protein YbgT [Cohaesibacter sp. ES.047]|nr:cytochrome bd-I oxidase subunit CydX [Cohaesibacter sp. ES.047]SNY92703.1 cyd operon protein YbgT [Cohaesibacter sp. ES.047]
MWYFAWILGLTAALAVGVINVMWYEAQDSYNDTDASDGSDAAKAKSG